MRQMVTIAAGVVARQKTDTKVTLTATITDADGNTETKEFELTVKAAVEQPKTTDYLFCAHSPAPKVALPTSRCTSPPARMA